ncbi:expressed unknown protein [Seminavis robusta]|uniref:Uncharacterized protein n=1 Tax=Seminavis robusta TaxID=568900 RepID=A0A9N8H4B4_9STRA|nr:expressed unknown protein [Seminavis robusta]|eukprot:Sro109_g054720.1 n/a (419) ;mRNA; r:106435-107691
MNIAIALASLGCGEDDRTSTDKIDHGYGESSDVSYGKDAMLSEEDLGYGKEVKPSSDARGYGEETMPSNDDLGYGDGVQTPVARDNADLGYGYEKASRAPSIVELGYRYGENRRGSAAAQDRRGSACIKAVQIRNGQKKRDSIFATRACSNSDDYDDSSVEYSDSEDEEDDDAFYNEVHEESVTEITMDDGGNDHEDGCAPPKYGIAAVTAEFREDAPMPKRISLQFNQQSEHSSGRTTTRSGRLDVSLGTSRLPRRGTMDHLNSSRRQLARHHSNISVSTTPVRRISMDLSSTKTSTFSPKRQQTRRITMNVSQTPCRRCSVGKTNPPVRTSSKGSVLDSNRRRTTMAHSLGGVMHISGESTRRLSMDMSRPVQGGQPERRRVTMNLSKSVLPRNRPASTRRTLLGDKPTPDMARSA